MSSGYLSTDCRAGIYSLDYRTESGRKVSLYVSPSGGMTVYIDDPVHHIHSGIALPDLAASLLRDQLLKVLPLPQPEPEPDPPAEPDCCWFGVDVNHWLEQGREVTISVSDVSLTIGPGNAPQDDDPGPDAADDQIESWIQNLEETHALLVQDDVHRLSAIARPVLSPLGRNDAESDREAARHVLRTALKEARGG